MAAFVLLPALLLVVPALVPPASAQAPSACPTASTFEASTGKCVSKPTLTCPDNTTSTTDNGQTCVLPAEQKCQVGELRDGTCVTEVDHRCPKGSADNGSNCTVDATRSCPGGGDLDGNNCVKAAEPACDYADLELENGYCYGSPDYGSTDGGTPSDSGTPTDSGSPTYTGEPGSYSGGPVTGDSGTGTYRGLSPAIYIRPVMASSYSPYCREGDGILDRAAGTCRYNSHLACADGTSPDDAGNCSTAAATDCPPGSRPVNGQCVVEKQEYCSDGGKYEPGSDGPGRCTRPPELVCTVGTLDGKGHCTTPASSDCGAAEPDGPGRCVSDPVCPAGTAVSSSGQCEKTTVACRAGTAPDSSGKCVPSNCAQGTVRNAAGDCVPDDPECARGTVRDASGECVPVREGCPQGTKQTSSGECVPVEANCPAGTAKDAAGLCRPVGGGTCPTGYVKTTSGVCAKPVRACPAGTVRDARGLCQRPPAKCPPGTITTAGGGCDPGPPDPAGSTPPPSRAAQRNELLLTPGLVSAGAAVTASGAGCTPSAEVVLTSEGVEVGRSRADSSGRFAAPLRFSTFRAGPRVVTAQCGRRLTTHLDMVLARSTDNDSRTFILLLFFLLIGFAVTRWQLGGSTGARQ
jgi:hypothetical protein